MLSKLTLSQTGLFLLSCTLLIQLAFVCALVFLYQSTERQIEMVDHADQVIGHLNKLSNLWSKLGVEFPRTLSTLDFAESPMAARIDEIHKEFKTLAHLVENNSDENAEIQALIADTDDAISFMSQAKDAYYERNKKQFFNCLEEVARLSDMGTSKSNQLVKRFGEKLEAHKQIQDRLSNQMNRVLFTGLCVNIGVALMVAYIFIAGIAKKAEAISQNTIRLSRGIPLDAPLKGDDEIAKLDRTFRQMANALAESARKERALVENARDLICTLDADGVFLAINPAVKTMLGRQPDEMIGRFCVDFVLPEDQLHVQTLLQNRSKTDKTSIAECRMLALDGSAVDTLVSANWSAADQTLFCVVRNVTQHRQMERLKRQFVAMVTHDLRSPLTAVGGTLHLMRIGVYKWDTERGKASVHEAINNVRRMLRLVADLSEMGDIDIPTQSLELQKCSLVSIINESVGSVRASAEQQNLTIDTDIDESWITADRLRMVQVLVNLLSNAIKFSSPGGSVTVSSHRDGKVARIEVTDQGVGISEADQKIIFDPYKQAKQQKGQRKVEGTGLGLTICKSIVEAHNGTIGVVSAIPQGITFWIEIPVTED